MPAELSELTDSIDAEILSELGKRRGDLYQSYFQILEYQLGWEKGRKVSTGKRVRPLLLLLTIQALGKNWRRGLPAAVALEMLHNYSLIHDDVEDRSNLRRGIPTVWKKWGEPQAINSGDALLNIALEVPWRLEENFPTEAVLHVTKRLQSYSLELTKGQFLDIDFESRKQVALADYWKMVEGKTCSLLRAAFEIGAILGDADERTISNFIRCGDLLGKAYQIQDDWMGIWGDEAVIGKSSINDIYARKKTFPIILGLEKSGLFAARWKKIKQIQLADIPDLSKDLEIDGVKELCEKEFDLVYRQAIDALDSCGCAESNIQPLKDFIVSLLMREK